MSIWKLLRQTGGPLMLAAVFVVASLGSVAAAPSEGSRNYIVTLSVADAGKALKTSARKGRQRMRVRAARTRDATTRLEAAHGFKARHRYTASIAGFSARLTPRQAARLKRDSSVATIRPARRFRIASQVVPAGITRVRAGQPGGAPDVDVDIAVLDTGIGPVGGNELDVQGGINCSGDGLGPNQWQDLYPSRHGTHVAGIAAARDNGVGIVGVAPGARLWSVRVFRGDGYGDEATIICGINWAVSTRSGTPPAGSQPIEVINMSIQGPRILGQPEACGVVGDADPMHVAVCSAYAAGITTVVAAGNDGINAAQVSPAGYDQAITVGAINDYDGKGGSQGTSACPFSAGEKDDHYASYSNWGGDVDIVAPGTCVLSTLPSVDGDATQRLTGTSMSTPHVTGAVARYLAQNPGTAPETVRRIVLAAGRLNWQLKTDPTWSGVNDSSDPNRLLDVQALLGAAHVRPWVYPDAATIAGGDPPRRFRVDLQRYGGYGGDVKLDLTGLPGNVVSDTYEGGPTLSGLSGLGTRMTLMPKPGGSDFDGTAQLQAEGPGGTPSGIRDISLLVDQNGPVISGPWARIVGGRSPLGKGNRTRVRVAWNASDATSAVARNSLTRRKGNGPWKAVVSGKSTKRGASKVAPNRRYRFRVRSTDTMGNQRTRKVPVQLSIRDSKSAKILRPSGSWITKASARAIGGSLLSSRQASASLVSTFDGMGIGVVAPIGPMRGRVRIRVDSGEWTTVKLKARRSAGRRVVFSRYLGAGRHTIEVAVLSGNPAIDAFIVQH